MAQLMPLPLTVSCFSRIQSGFTFLVPAHPGSPGKGPLNVCVCVCVCDYGLIYFVFLWIITERQFLCFVVSIIVEFMSACVVLYFPSVISLLTEEKAKIVWSALFVIVDAICQQINLKLCYY